MEWRNKLPRCLRWWLLWYDYKRCAICGYKDWWTEKYEYTLCIDCGYRKKRPWAIEIFEHRKLSPEEFMYWHNVSYRKW